MKDIKQKPKILVLIGAIAAVTLCVAIGAGVLSSPYHRNNPYNIPEGLMDDNLEDMLGYFVTPFKETGFEEYGGEGVLKSEFYLGTAFFLGVECDITVDYHLAGRDTGSQLPTDILIDPVKRLSSDELEDMASRAWDIIGNDAGYIPGTDLELVELTWTFSIRNAGHTWWKGIEEETEEILSEDDLAGTGLTRKLTEEYDSDGLRAERSYRKYSYYDASGDLVGVKTIWGDGREQDTIFYPHKDEYAELP